MDGVKPKIHGYAAFITGLLRQLNIAVGIIPVRIGDDVDIQAVFLYEGFPGLEYFFPGFGIIAGGQTRMKHGMGLQVYIGLHFRQLLSVQSLGLFEFHILIKAYF